MVSTRSRSAPARSKRGSRREYTTHEQIPGDAASLGAGHALAGNAQRHAFLDAVRDLYGQHFFLIDFAAATAFRAGLLDDAAPPMTGRADGDLLDQDMFLFLAPAARQAPGAAARLAFARCVRPLRRRCRGRPGRLMGASGELFPRRRARSAPAVTNSSTSMFAPRCGPLRRRWKKPSNGLPPPKSKLSPPKMSSKLMPPNRSCWLNPATPANPRASYSGASSGRTGRHRLRRFP